MVVGHKGCPDILARFIYLFHMPLFFFCSGYFFLPPQSNETFKKNIIKRIYGIYIPYVKWSIAFLLLHNFFYKIGTLFSLLLLWEDYLFVLSMI